MAKKVRNEDGLPVPTAPKMAGMVSFKGDKACWENIGLIMDTLDAEFRFGASVTDACIYAIAQMAKAIREGAASPAVTKPEAPPAEAPDAPPRPKKGRNPSRGAGGQEGNSP